MESDYSLAVRFRVLGLLALIVATANVFARAADTSFIGPLNTITILNSTVPSNGDVNPYGVARSPRKQRKPDRG